jgi:hypothetical protein
MDTTAVEKFLLDRKVKDEGAWLLGPLLIKGTMSLFPLGRATDDVVVAFPHQIVIDDISGVLKSFAREMLDPAIFSADNVTFCALTGMVILRNSQPKLIFITIRSISDASTQVLFEVFTKGFDVAARSEIKRFRTYMAKKIGW